MDDRTTGENSMTLDAFPKSGLVIAKAKRGGTYPGSLQSLNNSSEVQAVFDAYDFTRADAAAPWPAVSSTITPPAPGIWQISAYILFYSVNSAADTTGGRQLAIKRQTTNTILAKDSKPAFGPVNVATACGCEATVDMSGGTFGVYITGFQTSGVALLIEPYMTLEFKGL